MTDLKRNTHIALVKQLGTAYKSVSDLYRGPQPYKMAALIYLHTLINPKELTALRWSQVSLERCEVDLKFGSHPRILPISNYAVALFRELSDLYGEDGYVFPSMGYKKSHISHIQLEQVFKSD